MGGEGIPLIKKRNGDKGKKHGDKSYRIITTVPFLVITRLSLVNPSIIHT